MRKRPFTVAAAVIASGALAFTLSVGPASASVSTKKAPACAGKTKKKAIKAIKTSFDNLFNGANGLPLEEKFSFAEGSDDPAFLAVLNDIAAKNAATLAVTSVQVNTVTCTGKKAADVAFDLILSGTPATGLAPPGAAVLDGTTWKVAQTTICDLFALADPTLVQSGPCAEVAAGG